MTIKIFLNKIRGLQLNLSSTIIGHYCDLSPETVKHLLFECPALLFSKNILNIHDGKFFVSCPKGIKLKNLVYVLQSAFNGSSNAWENNSN